MSRARNLADLLDANGDVASGALDNVPPSNDASALTTGTLPVARIADGDITAAKLHTTAVTDKLGYTPVNKAGDTMTGDLTLNVNAGKVIVNRPSPGVGSENGRWEGRANNSGYISGIRSFVPAGQPGTDRVAAAIFTTTYTSSLQTGIDRLIVDPDGRVTMPYQPRGRFYWNQSATGTVTNMTAIENNQSAFSVTSGRIYVPISGWYSITAYGIATDEFDTRILKNTTGSSPFLGDFRQSNHSGGTHHGCGNTVVTQLTAGDYISLYRLSGSMYTSAGSSSPHNQVSIYFLG
jgi:hypothetical protein